MLALRSTILMIVHIIIGFAAQPSISNEPHDSPLPHFVKAPSSCNYLWNQAMIGVTPDTILVKLRQWLKTLRRRSHVPTGWISDDLL